jgi:hypothetical protein
LGCISSTIKDEKKRRGEERRREERTENLHFLHLTVDQICLRSLAGNLGTKLRP